MQLHRETAWAFKGANLERDPPQDSNAEEIQKFMSCFKPFLIQEALYLDGRLWGTYCKQGSHHCLQDSRDSRHRPSDEQYTLGIHLGIGIHSTGNGTQVDLCRTRDHRSYACSTISADDVSHGVEDSRQVCLASSSELSPQSLSPSQIQRE